MEKWVSTKEVAKKIGLSERTVRKWLKEGKIGPAIKLGTKWRIPEDVVNSLPTVNEQTVAEVRKHLAQSLSEEDLQKALSLINTFDDDLKE